MDGIREQVPTKASTVQPVPVSAKSSLDLSLEKDFRSTARSMLESLVCEHERILAERLQQLEIAERERQVSCPSDCGVSDKKEIPGQVGELSAAQSEADHSDASHNSHKSSGEASPNNSPKHVVRRMIGSGSKHKSLVRMSVNSLGSDQPMTWKMTADVVISSASNKFASKRKRRIPQSLRIREEVIEAIITFAIVLDMISLGVGARFSRSWSGWLVVDTLLTAVFTVDLLRKMYTSSSCKSFFCGGTWRRNVSELLLVTFTWVDIGTAVLLKGDTSSDVQLLLILMRLLRLGRLVRIFRVRMFVELFMMVNGVIGSYRTLLYSFVLISLPLYCVALVLTETLGRSATRGRGAEKFGHLEEALFTVFRCFVASDCTQEDGKPLFVLLTDHYGWTYGVLYCAVQFLMTFGLYNVITAIYVEKSVCAAKFNDLAVRRRRFQDRQYFEEKAKAMLQVIWQLYFGHDDPTKGGAVDFDMKAAGRLQLTRGFFDACCKQPNFINILRSLDISEDDQLDLFDTLDIDGRGTIDLMSLVIGVGKLRGEARKADIVSMGLTLRSVQSKLVQIESRLAHAHQRSRSEFRLGKINTCPT